MRPRNVFLCHASLDEEYVQRLKHYAAPIIRSQMADLRLWEDSSIFSGEPWSARIQQEINDSIAAVVVVSDNLLNSGYAMEHEMPQFLARAEAGQFQVLCLYARKCLVEEYGFQVPVNGSVKRIVLTKYQGLNSPERPLASLYRRADRDDQLVDAAKKLIATLRGFSSVGGGGWPAVSSSHDGSPLTAVPKLIRGQVTQINAPQKMIKVSIERRVQHATYGKTLSRRTKLNVHWEGEQHLVVGDMVDIMESRPISRIKHHVFVRKATSA